MGNKSLSVLSQLYDKYMNEFCLKVLLSMTELQLYFTMNQNHFIYLELELNHNGEHVAEIGILVPLKIFLFEGPVLLLHAISSTN